jgi:hypothetical protein
VTCYQRHLGWMFDALSIPYDGDHRAKVDAALKELLGLAPETRCPEVWSTIKALSESEREALLPEVSTKLGT